MQKPFISVKCPECDGTGKIQVSSLAILRKNAGLQQEYVAEALGLTRTSISNIERGIQTITIEKISKLAELYGVDEYDMYETAKALASVGVSDAK